MAKRLFTVLFVVLLMVSLAVFSYAVEPPVGTEILEYIQSSGTQYIDTGFKPNNNSRVVMDFVALPTSVASFLFGSLDTWSVNMYGFYFSAGSSSVEDFWNTTTSPLSGSPLSRSVVDKNKNVTTFNGVTKTWPNVTFQCKNNLVLFAEYYDTEVMAFTNARIFSCQVYNNGTLIRDYTPVRMNGNVGLWDSVQGQFYGNSGTGAFIGGPVIEVIVPPNPEYNITVSDDGNGSASSSVSKATAGTTVSLTATPDNGYVFSEWQVLEGDIDIVNNQFIMPSSDVSVKAVFVPDGAYSVTVQNDGFGTGSANPVRAQAGDRVTLSAVPALGYEFYQWQVVSGSVNISNNQFIMPDSDVVVKALFKPIVYTITLNQSPNGTATVSQQTGIIGDVITLTATPNEYYNFLYWDVTQGGITVDGNSFTMPASNVVLTPVFVKQSAVSSGYTFNSGVKDDNDITVRQGLADINFGNQPAGEYLINIYTYGQNYGVSYDIGVGSDTTTTRKLPYTQSGGVTTALYTHSGGEMVLDLNFTYYKSVLNSPAVWYAFFDDGTGSISTSITSSGNYVFNIIDVVACPTGLANSEDYGIYGTIVSFLNGQFNDIKSFLTEQIGRIAGDEESENDVNDAADELNKEVEDLNNLSGQLDEQGVNLEQQFESDFAVPDEVTGNTNSIQAIYDFLFTSLGIFSIFIWLPVVLAVIKKLLRL